MTNGSITSIPGRLRLAAQLEELEVAVVVDEVASVVEEQGGLPAAEDQFPRADVVDVEFVAVVVQHIQRVAFGDRQQDRQILAAVPRHDMQNFAAAVEFELQVPVAASQLLPVFWHPHCSW